MRKTLHILLSFLCVAMLAACSIGDDDMQADMYGNGLLQSEATLHFTGQWKFYSYSSMSSPSLDKFSKDSEGYFNAETRLLTIKEMPDELFLLMAGIENPSNVKGTSYAVLCGEKAYTTNSLIYDYGGNEDYVFDYEGHTVNAKFRSWEVAVDNYAHTISIGVEVTAVYIDGEKKSTVGGILLTIAQLQN